MDKLKKASFKGKDFWFMDNPCTETNNTKNNIFDDWLENANTFKQWIEKETERIAYIKETIISCFIKTHNITQTEFIEYFLITETFLNGEICFNIKVKGQKAWSKHVCDSIKLDFKLPA
jgi:hypothetical protein